MVVILMKFGFELDWFRFQSLVTICDFGGWGVVTVGVGGSDSCCSCGGYRLVVFFFWWWWLAVASHGCGCGCVSGLAWIEKKVVGFFRERERHR